MPLIDNRDDPPRMSGWWTVYTVVVLAAAVGIVVDGIGRGRWFAVVAFVALGASTVSQYVVRRRRHQEALAAFRAGRAASG